MGLADIEIEVEKSYEYWKGKKVHKKETTNPDLGTASSTSSSRPSLIPEDMIMDIEVYRAASKNDVSGFNAVLDKVSVEKRLPPEAVFETMSPLKNTLLHVAANFGNDEIVSLIAHHSPSILSKRNSKGDTALHVAAKAGHGSVVSTLIFLQRDLIDSSSSSSNTEPSSSSNHEAAAREVDGSEKRLLRIRNEEGNTALHEALIHGHEAVAEALIDADPEVAFCLNKENKSALYLAAEYGFRTCLVTMMTPTTVFVNPEERLKGKSVIHAAISNAATKRRKTDIIDFLLVKEPMLIHLRDEEGRTPLHHASSTGYLNGVRCLLGRSISLASQRDSNGLFPIHMASVNGHVHVVEELLQYCPYPAETISYDEQNILHAAVMSGKLNVVNYILKKPELEKLLNQKNKYGDTPLHLATMFWHPKIVSTMTWDKRVQLNLINNKGLTALDAAEKYMGGMASFRKRLTWTALRAAGAPRAPNKTTYEHSQNPNINYYKDRVNTLLLVSTLVATVTFAAGFTVPGGYNSDNNLEQGIATLLRHNKFHVFIFCDTIALYSSIMVAVILIWAQLGDVHLIFIALRLAVPLLGVALAMMASAFMAGIYIVVRQLNWLANAVLIMGLVFLVALLALFFPLCISTASSVRIFRYTSYYVFCLLIMVTGSYSTGNSEE